MFPIIGKWLDKKAKVKFKIYDVTNWNTNNYNKHIPNISKSKGSLNIFEVIDI